MPQYDLKFWHKHGDSMNRAIGNFFNLAYWQKNKINYYLNKEIPHGGKEANRLLSTCACPVCYTHTFVELIPEKKNKFQTTDYSIREGQFRLSKLQGCPHLKFSKKLSYKYGVWRVRYYLIKQYTKETAVKEMWKNFKDTRLGNIGLDI
jgi:hypothetical protein